MKSLMFTKVPNIAIRLEYLHFNPVLFYFQFLTRPTAANRNFPYHVRTSQVRPEFFFSIFTAPTTKLREGNVFSNVCLSTRVVRPCTKDELEHPV